MLDIPKKYEPYIMQEYSGLLLLGFGIIAIFFPTTRELMRLTEWLEWVIVVSNAVVGLALLCCRSLHWLDNWIVAAMACCAATTYAYTASLGINTASWVYILQIYFLIKLLGKVRADEERQNASQ